MTFYVHIVALSSILLVSFDVVNSFLAAPHLGLWRISSEATIIKNNNHYKNYHHYAQSHVPSSSSSTYSRRILSLHARPAKTTSTNIGSPVKDSLTQSIANPPEVSPVKIEALRGVVDVIEKNYGKGSIQKLGDAKTMNVETTSSGSITLDMALGGGYPRGRVVEIYGPESSGKTTLALHAVAEVQKAGGKVLLPGYLLF